MLAVLADQDAHDRILRKEHLVFEPKYDGIRALVALDSPVHIYSRLGNDKTEQFPEVAEPLARLARRLKRPVLLDGEIVAIDTDGTPLPFQHLQGRLHVRGLKAHASSRAVASVLIVFDLLRDGDDDLRPLPFVDRRARLERVFRRPGSDALRLIDSTIGNGVALAARGRALGWEGLLAKDPSARYVTGSRHPAWQKLKFIETEELVVGGWTAPRQSRSHFGALLLGYYLKGRRRRDETLVFAGQVGSGFTEAELGRVAALLEPLATDDSPFGALPQSSDGRYWVTPALVAQTKFTQWTLDGVLRNPVYLGLRDDKRATDVRLPDHRPGADLAPTRARRRVAAGRAPGPRRSAKAPARAASRPAHRRATGNTHIVQPAHPEPNVDALLAQLRDMEQRKRRGTLALSDGSSVPIGNLHKTFWPDPGITKGDLVRFYLRMAPYLLPVVADRPLVMKRFPNGVTAESFYQHRAPDPLPEGIEVTVVRESPEKPDSGVPYLVGGRLQALLYMAQLAVISQDPWFSRLPNIEEADLVAIDLDPMPEATFAQVLDVACWVHDELERLGTPSFAKTSGSEGVHIFIPLPDGTPYDAGMIFCQIVATVVASRHPRVATVERMVKKRPRDVVYIDYLQNIYGKTLACAYSARASPFGGVSTPLRWSEVHEGVKTGLMPHDFTMHSIFARLERVGDLWADLRHSEPARLEAAFSYEEE